MKGQLHPDVQQRLHAMCVQMAADQDLDGEVQRELYGHMEDKLLAYLNGEEAISEDDALILVREHFGDPAVIKGLLQSVHPVAAGKVFLRRATAMLCAYTVIMALTDRLIMWDLLCISQMPPLPRAIAVLCPFVPQVLDLTALFLLWAILRYWQKQADGGRPVWFLEYSAWIMVALCLAACAADQMLPTAKVGPPPVTPSLQQTWDYYYLPVAGLTVLSSVCLSLVCIWWCDRPPRMRASVLAACCLWAAFMLFKALLPMLVNLAWWRLVTVPVHQDARFPVEVVSSQFRHLQVSAVGIAVCGTLSFVLYVLITRFVRRKTDIS